MKSRFELLLAIGFGISFWWGGGVWSQETLEEWIIKDMEKWSQGIEKAPPVFPTFQRIAISPEDSISWKTYRDADYKYEIKYPKNFGSVTNWRPIKKSF